MKGAEAMVRACVATKMRLFGTSKFRFRIEAAGLKLWAMGVGLSNFVTDVSSAFASKRMVDENAVEEAADASTVGINACLCNHKVTDGNEGSYRFEVSLDDAIFTNFFKYGLPKGLGSIFLGASFDKWFFSYLLADGAPLLFSTGLILFISLDVEADNAVAVRDVGLMASLLLLDEATAAAYVFFFIRDAVSSRIHSDM